jgi:hypothetical protein
MNNANGQTRPIPQWKEVASIDVPAPFGHAIDLVEWEANYLLPQVVVAAEHVLKRIFFPH